MIETHALRKRYGEVEAVAGVDLVVRPGELFGLIGHNGAGKSTMFRMMLGLERPTAGHVSIDGEPVHGPAFRALRRRLGYLPESVVLYDNLTGLETLRFFASLKGLGPEACAPVLARVGLAHAADRRVRGYSKGMRQRLGFAQALLGDPTLLFLDEPTNGLDPQGIRDFYDTLAALRAEGVTIVITSHILSEIQERVDRLAVMKSGRIHAQGSVQSMREAMALPLRLDLRLASPGPEGLARVRRALAAVDGLDAAPLAGPRADDARVLAIHCPRALKMPALQAIAALGADVADLQVREPTLEDLLLGVTAAPAAAALAASAALDDLAADAALA